MAVQEVINIAKDFSDSPGARYISDGPHSGEEFYKNFLLPKFKSVCEKDGKLIIKLDGLMGCPPSFASASFGKLAKEYGSSKVLKHLEFISNESPLLVERIKKVIREHST
jgi:hypothetical protein